VIKFTDRTFNCNERRAYEIFEFIISLNTDKCFHFEVAADLFTDDCLELLSTAPSGRIQLEIGVQSFYEPTLKAVSRKTDLAKVCENIKRLVFGGNIHIHAGLIAGLPLETLDNFKDSFNLAYSLKAHHLQPGFLKMLHGSSLRRDNPGIVFNATPPYEITSSPWLSAADLAVIKRVEYALENTYNKGRFLTALSLSELDAFSLFEKIGYDTSPLNIYHILGEKSLEYMICDFLSAQKGENMPDFMKSDNKAVREAAKSRLCRKIRRCEAAVLPSGRGVYVDSENRDKVTGLYKLYFV